MKNISLKELVIRGSMIVINLFVILFLLLANGFFVASEFALVSVRQTRINQLANEGNKTAKITTNALKELDKYIAATQLGISNSHGCCSYCICLDYIYARCNR